MLERARGLTERQLYAIGELERRAVRHDGGRLKLEWGRLRSRPADQINDLLWWEGETLAGFLGLYAFGGAKVELSGMVAPEARRHGIGSALLQGAIELLRDRGADGALLIVPRSSEGGRRLAARFGGVLEHSEHALALRELAAGATAGSPGAEVRLRPATESDRPEVSALFEDGFGHGLDPARPLRDGRTSTLMVVAAEEVVGTISLSLDGERGGVYGFVIEREHRGRGFGRAALRLACGNLFNSGAAHINLEVATENELALDLYTDLGFRPVTTEDYYQVGV